MISHFDVPFYEMSRLTRAEQIELAELQEIQEADPFHPRRGRLNILLAKATSPDWMERVFRPRIHPREVAREEFRQRRERGSRSERRKWEHDQ